MSEYVKTEEKQKISLKIKLLVASGILLVALVAAAWFGGNIYVKSKFQEVLAANDKKVSDFILKSISDIEVLKVMSAVGKLGVETKYSDITVSGIFNKTIVIKDVDLSLRAQKSADESINIFSAKSDEATYEVSLWDLLSGRETGSKTVIFESIADGQVVLTMDAPILTDYSFGSSDNPDFEVDVKLPKNLNFSTKGVSGSSNSDLSILFEDFPRMSTSKEDDESVVSLEFPAMQAAGNILGKHKVKFTAFEYIDKSKKSNDVTELHAVMKLDSLNFGDVPLNLGFDIKEINASYDIIIKISEAEYQKLFDGILVDVSAFTALKYFDIEIAHFKLALNETELSVSGEFTKMEGDDNLELALDTKITNLDKFADNMQTLYAAINNNADIYAEDSIPNKIVRAVTGKTLKGQKDVEFEISLDEKGDVKIGNTTFTQIMPLLPSVADDSAIGDAEEMQMPESGSPESPESESPESVANQETEDADAAAKATEASAN